MRKKNKWDRKNIQQWHDLWRNDLWTHKQIVNRWAKRVITPGVRKRTQRESARVRTVKCYLYTSRRVHGSCCCLDTKLPERTKNLKSAQDHKWNPDSSDFDNNWDLLTLLVLVCAWLWRCRKLLLIPPFFVSPSLREPFLPLVVQRWRAPPRCAFCPCWRWRWREIRLNWNSNILNVVGLMDPMRLFAMSASALEYEVFLGLVLVERRAHLLMIYDRIVDTVVLLVYLHQLFSWRAYFQKPFRCL